METLGSRVKYVRQMMGFSQERLAELCEITQQTIQHLESDRVKRPSYLVNLADALGVDPRWLSHGYFDLAPDFENLSVSSNKPRSLTPNDVMAEGADLIPVYGYVSGSGYMQANVSDSNIVENKERHVNQRGAKDAFWVYVIGDSMEPRFYSNELAAVKPGRLPNKGEDCVIVTKDGDAHIKRFQSMASDKIIVDQFNPAKELEFSLKDIEAIHPVVGRG